MDATIPGPDGRPRCRWCAAAPEFLDYHDAEWGFPVADDRRLFEKLSLEGFQSGLSWRTILAKRENFRAAFRGFDFREVARFGERDVERLLQDAGIVRHRGKIEAVVGNAKRACELVEAEGSLAAFVWRACAGRRCRAASQVDVARIHRPVEGAETARLEVRRSDHRLRLPAGDGIGQRPRTRLRDPRQGRAGTRAFPQARGIAAGAHRAARPDVDPARRRPENRSSLPTRGAAMVRSSSIALLLASLASLSAVAPAAATQADAAPATDSASRVPLEHLPALAGDYFPIHSRATGRVYHVYVRLPEGYAAAPETRWPVVYLLDGDSTFPLLAPTHLFLHHDEHLPEAVIVGIAYGSFDPAINRRHVDFSAPGPDTPEGEGGAPAFLRFLERELLPETERRHRIDPAQRILLGQSRGGYFVLWSALQAPDLFRARIASNPAFSRTREALFAAPAAHRRDDLVVVLASGARDAAFRMENAREWIAAWQARGDRPWALRHEILPDGTHAASLGETYRRAMTWLFRDEIAAAKAEAASN